MGMCHQKVTKVKPLRGLYIPSEAFAFLVFDRTKPFKMKEKGI